jgi:hypothetical protein
MRRFSRISRWLGTRSRSNSQPAVSANPEFVGNEFAEIRIGDSCWGLVLGTRVGDSCWGIVFGNRKRLRLELIRGLEFIRWGRGNRV